MCVCWPLTVRDLVQNGDLLSFWVAGEDGGPVVVRPTGLECFGPLPGILRPLDFSMFMVSNREGRGIIHEALDVGLDRRSLSLHFTCRTEKKVWSERYVCS